MKVNKKYIYIYKRLWNSYKRNSYEMSRLENEVDIFE